MLTYTQIKKEIIKRSMKEILWWSNLAEDTKKELFDKHIKILQSWGHLVSNLKELKHIDILIIYQQEKK